MCPKLDKNVPLGNVPNWTYGGKVVYRLIAMDLDGTLLNRYGEVSNRNKKAINSALKKGIEVVIASRKNA